MALDEATTVLWGRPQPTSEWPRGTGVQGSDEPPAFGWRPGQVHRGPEAGKNHRTRVLANNKESRGMRVMFFFFAGCLVASQALAGSFVN